MKTRGGEACLAVVLPLALTVACSPTLSEPVAPEAPRARLAVAPDAPRVTPTSSVPSRPVVVVRAKADAGRIGTSARRLRNLLAEERGSVELVADRSSVSLYIEAVLEGADVLADPDYAKRPVGANTLEVLLVDDAAFAAPPHPRREGFGGIWRLTRHDDGTLVARTIGDTPFVAPPSPRSKEIARIRGLLLDRDVRRRLAGLAAFGRHAFYELVPDVIALLDDDQVDLNAAARRHPYRVREVAFDRLRALFHPLADAERPEHGVRAEWEAYWRFVTTRPPRVRAPVVAGETLELMRVAANQTFPELVGLGGGRVAIAVERLEKPNVDVRTGIALATAGAGGPPHWIAGTVDAGFEPQQLAASEGGAALVFDGGRDGWRLALTSRPSAQPIALALPDKTTCAAIAEDAGGFAIVSVSINASDLAVTRLDGSGRPRGDVIRIDVKGYPATALASWLHPLAIASLGTGGWLTAAETSEGVSLASIDHRGRPTATSLLPMPDAIHDPVLGVSGARIMVAARANPGRGGAQVMTQLLAAPGLSPLASTIVGDEVEQTSPLVVLDDGFALAWIEADEEVHLGRWDGAGNLIRDAVVHRGEVLPFHVALHRDGGSLLVAYQDKARYPYSLVARRIAVDVLR